MQHSLFTHIMAGNIFLLTTVNELNYNKLWHGNSSTSKFVKILRLVYILTLGGPAYSIRYNYPSAQHRAQLLSCDFEIPWTVACQTPLSMGFFKQEYWNGLSFPLPGDLSDPGIKLVSPSSPVLEGRFFITEPPGKPIPIPFCVISFWAWFSKNKLLLHFFLSHDVISHMILSHSS